MGNRRSISVKNNDQQSASLLETSPAGRPAGWLAVCSRVTVCRTVTATSDSRLTVDYSYRL